MRTATSRQTWRVQIAGQTRAHLAGVSARQLWRAWPRARIDVRAGVMDLTLYASTEDVQTESAPQRVQRVPVQAEEQS